MGLFRPTRLAYGVHSATGIFQRQMEKKFKGIPSVVIRIDDILVTGINDTEHLKNLRRVLEILKNSGLRLKLSKCEFFKDEVIYLGHRISKEGVSPVEEKVQAVRDAPTPRNVSELKSFLGLFNFYHRYVSNAAEILEPLHYLLRKNIKWTWGETQQNAFVKIKESLCSSRILVHYDPTKDLILACDASPYGLGVVLSHRMEDGSERPISYASRSLTTAERNYSQIQREALSIIYGTTKFHQYCYGRPFEIVTDHKPLLGLFGESKPLPSVTAARIQRWAVKLAAYNYVIKYKPGSSHSNADALSRLPLPHKGNLDNQIDTVEVYLTELDRAPVSAEEVMIHSRRDPVIAKMIDCVRTRRFPTSGDPDIKYFVNKAEQLSVEDGCLLWGNRVVIPKTLRGKVLEELHQAHPVLIGLKG